MARSEKPDNVKLIAGLITAHDDLRDSAVRRLSEMFGPIDLRSEIIDFDFTSYYHAEMGQNLKRSFVAFEKLISPDELADIKLQTNELELTFAKDASPEARLVNIDPGYVTSAKLVLASAKDFSHRIYLRDGIFAEVTLQYRQGRWQSSAWTFPDYGSGAYDEFLNSARQRYKQQIGQKP